MSTKHYAVIGHPIGHTMSPFIHKRLFELAGADADYTHLDIAPETLAEEYQNRLRHLDGFNITIPHKEAIIPLLDALDDKAKMYGSVNTVALRDGKATGYTTDPDGFIKALEAAGIDLDGRIMILGCGGVARTMAYEIALRGKPFEFAVSFGLIDQIIGTVDVLINATPVGMYPHIDEQPIHNCAIGRCGAVYDAIYNPLETALVKRAKANGSKAAGGMSMLVWQAVAAHQIWDGSQYDPKDIEQLVQDAAEEMNRQFSN